MRPFAPALAAALVAATHPAPLAAQLAAAPVDAASVVRTSTSVPGLFAPGTAGWDLLGAGLINIARLVRRRREG